ncbi:MAG: BrnA antitoxin family protein [Ottowia sp.]|nr:BrnA antitoxin family protein [Ottowia sp.]
MKQGNTSRKFTPSEIEAMLRAAPETVPYDPENPPMREEDWTPENLIVHIGLEDFRAQRDARRAAREAAAKTAKAAPEKPKKPRAIQIALRIPPDVLARWKAGGPGWQTRMVQRLSAP